MCVAIAQHPGAQPLTEAELSRGWRINSDGGGYAYIDRADNTIKIRKFMVEASFVEAYLADHAKHGAESPFLVHMRIATHGDIKIETAHPFRVEMNEGEMAFCHNGIISDLKSLTDKDTSDTMAFRDYFLEELPDSWLDNQAIVELVESYVGLSKLAFITTSPNLQKEMYIIAERDGVWNSSKTTWFSNDSCFTRTRYDLARWDSTDDDYWWRGGNAEQTQKDLDYRDATMSLVSRAKMNDMLVSDAADVLLEQAIKLSYCEFCLYKPCQCDDTCYYCNRTLMYCGCPDNLTIEQMRFYLGDSVFQEARREELSGEYSRLFMMQGGIVDAETVDDDEEDEDDFDQEMAEIFNFCEARG